MSRNSKFTKLALAAVLLLPALSNAMSLDEPTGGAALPTSPAGLDLLEHVLGKIPELPNWHREDGWLAYPSIHGGAEGDASLPGVLRAKHITHQADLARYLAQGYTIWPNVRVELLLAESTVQVGAPAAWNRTVNGQMLDGTGTTIAIIDTGVDYMHPDLGGCFGPGCKVSAGIDISDGDSDPMDPQGHGTHVAATAAGIGTYPGVAPGAEIWAVKVFSGSWATMADIVAGIAWAMDPNGDNDTSDHADVISLSLGCAPSAACNPEDPVAKAVRAAVEAGAVVTVAAGNSFFAGTIGSPGLAPEAITVAAVTKAGWPAGFSSIGPVRWGDQWSFKPDIAAPGVAICAAAASNGVYSPNCGPAHVAISGTSMATPHVAGAAALIVQANPNWGPEQVKAELMATAVPFGDSALRTTGSGTLDVSGIPVGGATDRVAISLDPLPARAWPRDLVVRTLAGEVVRWEILEGYASEHWIDNPDTLLASGTTIPASGLIHTFDDMRSRSVAVRAWDAHGNMAVAFQQMLAPAHDETLPTIAGRLGQTSQWQNAEEALALDRRGAHPIAPFMEANPEYLVASVSLDGGTTFSRSSSLWLPHPENDDWGRWAHTEQAFYLHPGVALASPGDLVVRLALPGDGPIQDFTGFDLGLAADTTIREIIISAEVRLRSLETAAGLLEIPDVGQSRHQASIGSNLDGGIPAPEGTRFELAIDAVYAEARMARSTSESLDGVASVVDLGLAAEFCGWFCDPHVSMVVPADGRPVLATHGRYFPAGEGSSPLNTLLVIRCGDATCSANNTVTVVDGGAACPSGCSPGQSVGRRASITLGADGLPQIAYLPAYFHRLHYVACGDLACTTNNTYTVVDGTPSGNNHCPTGCDPTRGVKSPTLTTAPDGRPTIVYARAPVDWNGGRLDLVYLRCGNTACDQDNSYAVVAGQGCAETCETNVRPVSDFRVVHRSDGRPVVIYRSDGYFIDDSQVSFNSHLHAVDCMDPACRSINGTNGFIYAPQAPAVGINQAGIQIATIARGDLMTHQCLHEACLARGEGSFSTYLASYGGAFYSRTTLEGGSCMLGCDVYTNPQDAHLSLLGDRSLVWYIDGAAGQLRVIECGPTGCGFNGHYGLIDGAGGCVAQGCSESSRPAMLVATASGPDLQTYGVYIDYATQQYKLAIYSPGATG